MRFLLTAVTAALLCAVAWFVCARVIDPRGYFGSGVFPLCATNVSAEKMRLFREACAATPVDGVLFGSSRSVLLEPSSLALRPHERFFNFGIGDARPQDMLALYRWLRRPGPPPRKVIIGLDVKMLADDQPSVQDALLYNTELASVIGNERPGPLGTLSRAYRSCGRFKETFTARYLRDCFRSAIAYHRARRPQPGATPAAPLDAPAPDADEERPVAFHPDGGLIYSSSGRHGPRDATELSANIESDFLASHAFWQEHRTLAPARKAALRALIEMAEADGASVTVWLTPMHPHFVALLSSDTSYAEQLRQTREYLQAIGHELGFEVKDLHDLASYGGVQADWRDSVHTNPSEAARIAAALAKSD